VVNSAFPSENALIAMKRSRYSARLEARTIARMKRCVKRDNDREMDGAHDAPLIRRMRI
jgi:hypothetical protein